MKKLEKRISKSSLLASALALMLCVAMLLGTTFAWFTDSVTSSGNIIKSGTLDVEMFWKDGTKDPANSTEWEDASNGAIFNYTLWEPGYVQVRHVNIKNVGTLALKYQFAIVANGTLAKNSEGHSLADAIDVYYVDPAIAVTERTLLTDAYKLGSLTDILANIDSTDSTAQGVLYPAGSVPAGGKSEETVTIALKMREEAGNEYQDMALGTDFSVQVLATQFTYEEDSLDHLYDENADGTPDNVDWPINISSLVVTDPSAPLVITSGNVTVTVPAGVAQANDTYELVVENVSDELDFNTGYNNANIEITLKKNGTPVAAEAGVTYGVVVDLPDATAVGGVTHNGAAITEFTFADNKLSFTTDSFSPFVVSYVDKNTCMFAYDSGKTPEENGAQLTAYLNDSANCKKNVFISAGTYVTNGQITFDGRAVNLTGLGNVTLKKGHDYHLFTLQDSYNPNSDVVFNIRNLKLDGNNTNRNGLNVKYNVTVNLENVVFSGKFGWSDILLDNGNGYSTLNPQYYNDTRTVVNCKNVKARKVSMDALPCTSTSTDYTTYAVFNYDAASSVEYIERQSVNADPNSTNLLVNGDPLLGSVAPVSTVAEIKTAISSANVPAGAVIDGNGATVETLTTGINKDVTIKNVTFEGQNGLRNCYANDHADVVIEDCTIKGRVYGAHFDGGTGSVSFKNCDIYGWNSFGSTLSKVTFTNCRFHKSGYACIRFYQNAEINDCFFDDDFEWVDVNNDNITISLTNNTGLDITKLHNNKSTFTAVKWILDGVDVSSSVTTH